jgi:hypothetical protein
MSSETVHQISALTFECDQAPGDTTALVPLESSKDDIHKGDSDAQLVIPLCPKSETSTLTYSQEPWTTFKEKVTALSISLFPKVKAENVHVERMKGGSSNRIAGTTITPVKRKTYPLWRTYNVLRMAFGFPLTPTATKTNQYILRIPRWGNEHMVRDMAVLMFASIWGYCRVPEIVSYDTIADNELGGAYVLQQRLSGHNLGLELAILNFERRKDLTREAIQLILNLQRAATPSCAVISKFSASAHGTMFHATTLPIPPDSGEDDGPNLTPAKEQTTLEFIERSCNRWKIEKATYLDKPHCA